MNEPKTYGQKIDEMAAEIVKMYKYFMKNPIEGVSPDIAFHDARMQKFVAEEAIKQANKILGLDD